MLRELFRKYFEGEWNYEQVKEKINEMAYDSREASEALEIFEKVEAYFIRLYKSRGLTNGS